jgi:hypothetical protein
MANFLKVAIWAVPYTVVLMITLVSGTLWFLAIPPILLISIILDGSALEIFLATLFCIAPLNMAWLSDLEYKYEWAKQEVLMGTAIAEGLFVAFVLAIVARAGG